MTDQKICRDCKYYQGNWDIADRCMHPEAVFFSEIDGIKEQELCAWMRTDKHKCGPDAKWFVQYTGNRDLDDFFGFICALAVCLLICAALVYGPTLIWQLFK